MASILLQWPSTLHKIQYVIVSLSRNICWNNTGLWHRSSELCRQLQRFNGCQTRKSEIIRRWHLPHHPIYHCWHQNWQTWRIGQEGITLPSTAVSHRKLFSLTGGGSVAFNIHHCYLISSVSARSRFLELSDSLAVCGHVNNVVTSCAQSVQAMRILRAHGMATSTIFIYKRIQNSSISSTAANRIVARLYVWIR